MVFLLFPNKHWSRAEVDVINLGSQDLASSGTSVRGDDEHRKHKWLLSMFLYTVENFLDLTASQKKAFPKFRLFHRGQTSTLNNSPGSPALTQAPSPYDLICMGMNPGGPMLTPQAERTGSWFCLFASLAVSSTSDDKSKRALAL
jgi:hypothetical protein